MAQQLFEQQGTEGVTMRQIAAQLGYSTADARAKAVGQAYLRFALAEPQAYRLMFKAAGKA